MNLPLTVYLLLCLSGFFLIGENSVQLSSVWDNLYLSFFGVTKSGFRLTTYLYFSIVFLGFVYLFQLRLHQVMDKRIYYILIRYKSLASWFILFFLYGCALALLLILSLLGLTILTGTINGQSLTIAPLLADVALPEMLYHFIVNGFLQIANYMLLSFIAVWVWKESHSGLMAIGVFLIAGFPVINIGQWLPFAMNSLGYLGPDHNVFRDTFILLLFLMVELIGVLHILQKRKIIF